MARLPWWLRLAATLACTSCGHGSSGLAPDAGTSDAAVTTDAMTAPDAWGTIDTPELIDGTPASGPAVHVPADWTTQAGPWNAKAAAYCPAVDRLAFEVSRQDIVGGSIASNQ